VEVDDDDGDSEDVAPVQPGYNTIGRTLWNGRQDLSVEAAGIGITT